MSTLTNIINKKSAKYVDLNLYEPITSVDGDAILRSITNALQCEIGDRFFNPEVYIDTDNFVFELNLPQLKNYHIRSLEEQIQRTDSRIKSVNIAVKQTRV